MHLKRIVAREWLYLIILILLGLSIRFSLIYFNSSDCNEKRQILFKSLTTDYNENIGTFEEFSKMLDDNNNRLKFYQKFSEEYDLRSYEIFERTVTGSKFTNAFNGMVEEKITFKIAILILIPYLVFIFIRSLIWSIRVIKKVD